MDSQSAIDKMISALYAGQSIRENVATTAVSSGISLMQKKKYAEAAKVLKQAVSLKPDYIDAYNMLASAYTQLGKKKEAIEAYTVSLKIDRNQDQVQLNLANIYIDDKNFTEAEKTLKAAIRSNPLNATAQYTLGHLYVQLEKYQQAETAFKQTIKLSPKDGNAYYGLGLALSKEGKLDDAITQLTKAVGLKKDFAPALFELGNVYAAQENTDKVQEQIDALKRINTSQSYTFATDLEAMLTRPGLTDYLNGKGTLDLSMGPISLIALDPTNFISPDTSSNFSVSFSFDSEMDPASVTDITNWRISKASGGTAGIYNNGLYSPRNAAVPFMPRQVIYDPESRQATVIFTLRQNSTADGIIDPSRLVFKFSGEDINGKTMDPAADQYDYFADKPF